MDAASPTEGLPVMYSPDFAVGQRVRVYPASDVECYGVIVDDFGDQPGFAVAMRGARIADPGRRWAVNLDDGTLVFVDSTDIGGLSDISTMATEEEPAAAQAWTLEVQSASRPAPGPGKILMWSVSFPVRDPDNPDDPHQAPTVTARVTLDDQDGLTVHAQAASVIDYESGAIDRGAPVEVRYEKPEEETSDNPVWVFDLVDDGDSDTS